jgi:hypothetical protein
VAAAVATGAAALVLDLRPELGPAALAGVLVGSARPLDPTASEPVTAAGAGLVDPAAAASAGLAVEPSTVSFGRASGSRWRAERTILVRNVSGRSLRLSLGVTTDPGSGIPLTFAADPATATVDPGATVAVRIVVSTAAEDAEPATVSGAFVVQADGVAPARVPWAVAMGGAAVPLVSEAALSRPAFAPSRREGTVLTFRAGAASERADGVSIDAVGLLDVELETARGRSLGVVTRLRDLLPGTYGVRITGRGPSGRPLRPGRYVLVLRAWSADAAEGGEPATVTRVPFRIVR